jgi:ubiquinone biosynthesis protein
VSEQADEPLETPDILDAIRDWIGTIDFLPPAYAVFRPLVTDGFVYFLSRLPPDRLNDIMAAQFALADDVTPNERLIALVRLCPTLHKLGQVVARQPALSVELRARLQGLETLLPPPGNYGIDEIIAAEIGSIPGLTVDGDALAEGSVAFVVPFEWREEPDARPRRGVFKALKPQAEQRLLEDLAVWSDTGDYLEIRIRELGLAPVDVRAMLDGVARLLRNEIRLDQEQVTVARAYQFYADSADVVIPQLFPFCTPRLTAMERIDGVKVTDAECAAPTRRRLAQTIVRALLAKPFWSSPAEQPFFHADPHAGNLLATPDGRLAVLDWALTTTVSQAQLAAVVQVFLAAATLDHAGAAGALGELGHVNDARLLDEALAAALGDVRRGTFPGFTWLTGLLDRLGRSGILTFPEEMSLFRKALLTLTDVARDVWPAASVDQVLIASGGTQFIAESWLRSVSPFDSRDLGTHVSTADVARFVTALSWVPARYMLGAYGDVLALLSR